MSHRFALAPRLLPLLLAACGSSSGTLFQPAVYPKARIAAREAILELDDARAHVQTTRDFDTPLVSSPGQNQGRQIALHPQARNTLQERMNRVLGSAPARVRVLVIVQQGEAGWNASWTAETAFARVALRVRIYDDSNRRLLLSGTGRANAEVSSLDVSDEESAELFDRVVVRAFEEVITQPDFVSLINAALSGAPPSAEAFTQLDRD